MLLLLLLLYCCCRWTWWSPIHQVRSKKRKEKQNEPPLGGTATSFADQTPEVSTDGPTALPPCPKSTSWTRQVGLEGEQNGGGRFRTRSERASIKDLIQFPAHPAAHPAAHPPQTHTDGRRHTTSTTSPAAPPKDLIQSKRRKKKEQKSRLSRSKPSEWPSTRQTQLLSWSGPDPSHDPVRSDQWRLDPIKKSQTDRRFGVGIDRWKWIGRSSTDRGLRPIKIKQLQVKDEPELVWSRSQPRFSKIRSVKTESNKKKSNGPTEMNWPGSVQ